MAFNPLPLQHTKLPLGRLQAGAATQPVTRQACRRRCSPLPPPPLAQCELLAKEFGVPFFSAGELIRAHIGSGSAEGKRLQDIIMQGHIIPSEV